MKTLATLWKRYRFNEPPPASLTDDDFRTIQEAMLAVMHQEIRKRLPDIDGKTFLQHALKISANLRYGCVKTAQDVGVPWYE